jgi:hypothetical protein
MMAKGYFRLYAVTARYPAKLAEAVELERKTEGVYDVRWGIRNIRIIVLSRISPGRKNAIWQLFSAVPEKVAEGVNEYQWRGKPSWAINELFSAYKLEGIIAMPYTMEDFKKDVVRENLKRMSPQEILENIPLDALLKGLSVEERLKGISNEELVKSIKKRLSKSERKTIQELLRDDLEEE